MTYNLSVHNYKCLREFELLIEPLTILCGVNNVGKSSVIQSLVILHTAAVSDSSTIPINDLLGVDLGTVADILTHAPDADELVLSLKNDNGTITYRFDTDQEREDDRFLTLTQGPDTQRWLIPNNGGFGFCYLCAERNGPRSFQKLQSRPKEQMQIGPRGQYAFDTLSSHQLTQVRKPMAHPSQNAVAEPNVRLQHNLELWMQDVFGDFILRARTDKEAGTATMQFGRKSVGADWTLPPNCGFGISYALPIYLAGLLLVEGGMLVVENPEAHLHPKGQSQIGSFLGRLAASGVYVIVETHSEHVLNGIRLACIDEHPLKKEDVCIHNFIQLEMGLAVTEEIRVTETGNLTKWPVDFFDQSARDLARILKARKKV